MDLLDEIQRPNLINLELPNLQKSKSIELDLPPPIKLGRFSSDIARPMAVILEPKVEEKDFEFDFFFGAINGFVDYCIDEKVFEDFLQDFNIENECNVPSAEEILLKKKEDQDLINLLDFLEGFFIVPESEIPTFEYLMYEKLKQERLEHFNECPFKDTYDLDPFHITCQICLKTTPDHYTLDCFHRFCTNCTQQYFSSLFQAFQILPEDLKCPECFSQVSEKHFIWHLTHDEISKLEALREKIKFQLMVAKKQAVACPVPDCSGFAHLLEGEKITACNKCRVSLCALCGMNAHPQVSCEDYLTTVDNGFEKFLLENKCKKCPTCGFPVEKISGCQFLYCTSPICKGQKHLCNLCGKFLTEALHHTHYKTKGPYGDSCNTLDGIPEDVKINQE